MMFNLSDKLRHGAAFAAILFLTSLTATAQTVYTRPSAVPQPIGTPSSAALVKQTARITPGAAPDAATPDVAQLPLEPNVAGTRGVLVETVDGKTVMDNQSNVPFNPASNVKIATALAVLKTLKPNYRFQTKIYTDGAFNQSTGSIDGNVYVVGNDPSFNYEHAVAVADALNKMNVRQINGDLIVTAGFTLGYTPSAIRSGALLAAALDANKRPAAAVRAWQNQLLVNKQVASAYPHVVVTGKVSSEELPTNLRLLVTHESSPLKDILKVCLSYSNNFIAERLGDAVGGYFSVERIVEDAAKIEPADFQIASSSGLGVNRVTPRAMMRVFRAFHNELAKNKMSITDVLPVAGIDEGTLKNRFTSYPARGSVIGKTGTLPGTDGGVSSLVGQMGTANGEMLFFVIFNQRGNVNSFRNYQNNLVTYLQNQRGGAATFQYVPKSFATILSNTKVTPEKTGN